MTDKRPICNNANQHSNHNAVRMQPKRNGVTVDYGVRNRTVQSGDLWECPACGNQIIEGFGRPFEQDADPFIADVEESVR